MPTTELHCLPDCLFVFSQYFFFVFECKVAIQLIWSIPLLFQAADKAACGKNVCMLPYVYCRGVGAGMGRVGRMGNCPLKVLGNPMIFRRGFPIYCLPNQVINASYTTVIYLTLQHIFLPVYILSVQCCTYLLLGSDVAGFCLDRVGLLYRPRGRSQTTFTRRGG